MGILDEAIREHLALKRQSGADDSELKKIEDEAFGPPARPGDIEQPSAEADAAAEAPTTHMAEAGMPPAEQAEAPPQAEAAPPQQPAVPAQSEAEEASIVDQPTEHFDVEGEIVAEGAPTAEPTGQEPPLEAEISREDDFFDEQSLSEELDQALDSTEKGEGVDSSLEADSDELPLEEEGDEDPVEEAVEDIEGEEPTEAGAGDPALEGEPPSEEGEPEGEFFDQEDVLEETPEFLQDTPESDRLWFEQKPPKDFDFDD